MKKYAALVIDDHKVTCSGYQYFFENAFDEGLLPQFEVEFSHDSEDAFKRITKRGKSAMDVDIVFLDIRLPSFPEEKIFSGEDLEPLLRQYHPKTKIVVQTMLSDNHLLYNIFKNLNPESIIVKLDLDYKNFVDCINDVLNDSPYYSSTFSKLIRNQFSKSYVLDQEDREFLYLLNNGIPSKDIPDYLHWSPSKVEKRKRLLREKFEVDDKNVLSLLQAAKKAGFI